MSYGGRPTHWAARVAGMLFVLGLVVPAPIAVAGPAGGAGVVSDTAPLRSVVVLPPGPDLLTLPYLQYVDAPVTAPIYAEGAVEQHARLVQLLRRNHVVALDLRDLLQNAIENARKAGQWDAVLQRTFPRQSDALRAMAQVLDADMLLGRDPSHYYTYATGGYLEPLIPQSPGLFYTRDFAVSLPRGVLLTYSRSRHRRHEHSLGRLLFAHADALKDRPVIFDSEAEGVRCEGGDIIVKDERTILMGIGNLSDREAARALARRAAMDVIGVSMPPLEEFSGANIQILHLDTVFNLVDRKKALTVPYLFLRRYAGRNPLVDFLRGIQARPQEEAEKGEIVFPQSLERAIASIPKVGWLTLFSAGTGEEKDLGTKLGDYMLEEGYELIPVGGERGTMPEDQYINERVLYEMGLQGANVVQVAPGKVLAYAHNAHTNAALESHGVKVLRFEGKYLADMQGGPHCLTMPLTRQWP